MSAALRRLAAVLSLASVFVLPALAQNEQPGPADQSPASESTPSAEQGQAAAQPPKLGFALGLGLGVQTFNGDDQPGTWQFVSFTPDLSYGKLGVGLDLGINYNFTGANNSFIVRRADWWPRRVTVPNVLGVYLPKIAYVRWGLKGDPLFVKLGSFTDGTLGDGFIMGDYNNTLFLPTERHFGLQADVDGSLFDFPYVGAETVIGNLAQMDVLGLRAYARPLVKMPIPIFNNLEVGITAAVDTNPYFDTLSGETATANALGVFGLGAMLPIIYQKDVFSLVTFTDAATIQAKTWGTMAGVGGRIINIFTYGAQLRLLGRGFTPTYFGPAYDALRDQQYNGIRDLSGSGVTFGGLVSLGTSLLGDKLIFKVSLDTPFLTDETDPLLSRPHVNGILSLAPGALPVFSFDFMYDKKGIGTFSELVDPTNAAIQGKINVQSGPAVLSFVYIVTYDARNSPDPWTVTSGLQVAIALM